MAKVLVIDGKVCADAGTVRLDCGCGPSLDCCTPPTASLYLPPASLSAAVPWSMELRAAGSYESVWSAPFGFVPGASITRALYNLDLTLALETLKTLTSLYDAASGSPETGPCTIGVEDSYDAVLPPAGAGGIMAGTCQLRLTTSGGALIEDEVETLYLTSLFLRGKAPVNPAGNGDPVWLLGMEFTTERIYGPLGDPDSERGRIFVSAGYGIPCNIRALGPYSGLQRRIVGNESLFIDYFGTARAVNTGGVAALAGGDSLRWQVSVADQQLSTVATGPTITRRDFASLDIFTLGEYEGADATAYRSFGACPAYIAEIESCAPTSAEACCEPPSVCGKIDPALPFRWGRQRTLVASIEDADPAGIQQTIPGWITVPPEVSDIVSMSGVDPVCGVSSNSISSSAGSATQVDRLGTQRILQTGGYTFAGGVPRDPIPGNITVEPFETTPGIRRLRVIISQPIIWTGIPIPAVRPLIGHLRIVAETPALSGPTGSSSTLANITEAYFQWENLAINDADENGFTLDTSVNPDPIDDLTGKVVGFVYLAGPCPTQVQIYPEIGPGTNGQILETMRFGWLNETTTTFDPAKRRKIIVRFNTAAIFTLQNAGWCNATAGAVSASSNCVSCGGPIVNGVCQVCGQRSARPCVGCGN